MILLQPWLGEDAAWLHAGKDCGAEDNAGKGGRWSGSGCAAGGGWGDDGGRWQFVEKVVECSMYFDVGVGPACFALVRSGSVLSKVEEEGEHWGKEVGR